MFERLPPDRLNRLVEAWTSRDLLPPVRPSVGVVLIDDTERLWVSGFEPRLPQRRTDSREWDAIDLERGPVGRLVLPEGMRLVSVRGGRALVVQLDELDAQSLAVYPIIGAS